MYTVQSVQSKRIPTRKVWGFDLQISCERKLGIKLALLRLKTSKNDVQSLLWPNILGKTSVKATLDFQTFKISHIRRYTYVCILKVQAVLEIRLLLDFRGEISAPLKFGTHIFRHLSCIPWRIWYWSWTNRDRLQAIYDFHCSWPFSWVFFHTILNKVCQILWALVWYSEPKVGLSASNKKNRRRSNEAVKSIWTLNLQ